MKLPMQAEDGNVYVFDYDEDTDTWSDLDTTPVKTIKSIYLIGSLRNDKIVEIGNAIRGLGIDAFDNWWSAGPEADDMWKKYNQLKGLGYKEALQSYEARHVFEFDLHHLNRCDAAALILPAGRSGHLELGYVAGLGKPTYVVFPDGEPEERYDVMYNFATGGVHFSVEEFLDALH